MSLAQRTFSGFIWTFASRIGTRFSIFVVGIILARLLTPADFGLVAMISVFFAIASSLVESGFTSALVRETSISEADKSTVFFINIFAAIILYLILWFGSPFIATFFNQPELITLTRIMGLSIIFSALSIVQRAVLIHSLRFKLLSKIGISVSIITGVIAIYMAYIGMGVLSLAIKYILSGIFISIIFFIINPWLPSSFINKDSFKRLFGFGSKILLTGLINKLYSNIYNLIIGKFFSPEILGFYNRGFTFTSQTITTILISLQQVTYPILSKTKDDPIQLKTTHQKIININTFINFPLAIILAFTAQEIVILLLGQKWIGAIPFIQLLCISAFVNHFSSINLNLFKVIGRSDLNLKVSIYSKILATLVIIIGINFGVWGLVIGSVIVTYIEVYICMYFASNNIEYSLSKQFADVFRNILLIIPLIIVLILLSNINFNSNALKLFTMAISGGIVYLATAHFTKSKELSQIKEILLTFVSNRRNTKQLKRNV